jgi:hypothetical protein
MLNYNTIHLNEDERMLAQNPEAMKKFPDRVFR